MNNRDKTKDEVITELQQLQHEYSLLISSCNKERIVFKQMEEALHLSENQYRTLAENTSLIIARLDRTFHHLYVNPAAYQITGIKPEEYIGKTHRELGFASEQCDHWEASIEKVFTSGKSIQESVEFEGKFGKMYLDWRLYPEFDMQGKVVSVLSNVHDTTDLRLTEEMLKQNEARLKVALKSVNMAVFNQDRDLRYTWMFQPQIGYTTDQVIGKTDIELLPKDAAQEVTEIKRIALEKGVSGHTEIEVATENMTTYFDLVVEPLLNSEGHIVGITGASLDITELKQVENSLRRALDWQEAIFQGSRDAIFISDPDSRFVAVNNAASELTGYTREQLLKMRIPDIHDTLDLKAYKMYHQRIFDGEEILSEAKILRSDGAKIDTEFNNKCVLVAGKLYMHTSARDITERNRVYETLAVSEAKFRSIFENSVVGISIASPGGGIIQVNKAYARFYGYNNPEHFRSEVSDTTVLFAHSEERKEVLRELKEKGFMKAREFELIRRDGSHFFALVSASEVRDNDGKLLYNQATHIDLTEQKTAENELRISNERHRLIIENSGLGIAYYSIDGRILFLNNVALENLGGKHSDYIGKYLTEVFENEAGNVYIDRLRSAAVSKNPLVFEDYVELDGKPGWYLSTHSRIINRNGVVDGVQVIADNITDLKNAENKLKESQKKFRNLSHHLEKILEKERSAIAMNLHDDLGQKLTALGLDLAWIRGRIGVQSASVRKKLQEMHLMINEIVISIQELSSFLKPTILSDLGLYPALISLLEKFEKQSGIRCHFQRGSEEPDIEDNISLVIYRVVQEALTNVSRHAAATAIEIKIFLSKSKIEVEIKDNGKGIEKEQIISPASIRITGIKERVRSVHGKVKFKGVKDSGTTIMVSIPLSND